MRATMGTRFTLLVLFSTMALGLSPGLAVAADPDEPAPGAAVVLKDPGTEPRELLRYDYSKGQVEDFTLTMDMGMSMEMTPGGSSGWVDTPTITMSATSTVTAVGEDGTYEIETVFTDVTVSDAGDPAMVEQLRSQMAAMVGMTGRTHLDRRGRVLEMETTMPAGYVGPPGVPQPSQFDAMAANTTQALPEEPVGEGAVWEVSATDASLGFEAATVTMVTLDELREDGSFTATGEMHATGEGQAMVIPGMPAEAEASIDFYELTGSYHWDIDPTRLASRNDVQARGSAGFAFDMLDESMRMEMTTEMGVEVRPEATE